MIVALLVVSFLELPVSIIQPDFGLRVERLLRKIYRSSSCSDTAGHPEV